MAGRVLFQSRSPCCFGGRSSSLHSHVQSYPRVPFLSQELSATSRTRFGGLRFGASAKHDVNERWRSEVCPRASRRAAQWSQNICPPATRNFVDPRRGGPGVVWRSSTSSSGHGDVEGSWRSLGAKTFRAPRPRGQASVSLTVFPTRVRSFVCRKIDSIGEDASCPPTRRIFQVGKRRCKTGDNGFICCHREVYSRQKSSPSVRSRPVFAEVGGVFPSDATSSPATRDERCSFEPRGGTAPGATGEYGKSSAQKNRQPRPHRLYGAISFDHGTGDKRWYVRKKIVLDVHWNLVDGETSCHHRHACTWRHEPTFQEVADGMPPFV